MYISVSVSRSQVHLRECLSITSMWVSLDHIYVSVSLSHVHLCESVSLTSTSVCLYHMYIYASVSLSHLSQCFSVTSIWVSLYHIYVSVSLSHLRQCLSIISMWVYHIYVSVSLSHVHLFKCLSITSMSWWHMTQWPSFFFLVLYHFCPHNVFPNIQQQKLSRRNSPQHRTFVQGPFFVFCFLLDFDHYALPSIQYKRKTSSTSPATTKRLRVMYSFYF